jgi:NADH-quinone oxidoreductase subunit J
MLAVITVGAALMVVAVRNLLHAVLFLVLSFIGVAGLYITLSADFVAIAQILIYVGAISVLIIFALLLTPRASRDNAETFLQGPALVLAAMFAFTVGAVALVTDWDVASRGPFTEALLNKYVLPFEIASVLLLAAMVGAIVLVRED